MYIYRDKFVILHPKPEFLVPSMFQNPQRNTLEILAPIHEPL